MKDGMGWLSSNSDEQLAGLIGWNRPLKRFAACVGKQAEGPARDQGVLNEPFMEDEFVLILPRQKLPLNGSMSVMPMLRQLTHSSGADTPSGNSGTFEGLTPRGSKRTVARLGSSLANQKGQTRSLCGDRHLILLPVTC
jgi:hypothetical protein